MPARRNIRSRIALQSLGYQDLFSGFIGIAIFPSFAVPFIRHEQDIPDSLSFRDRVGPRLVELILQLGRHVDIGSDIIRHVIFNLVMTIIIMYIVCQVFYGERGKIFYSM